MAASYWATDVVPHPYLREPKLYVSGLAGGVTKEHLRDLFRYCIPFRPMLQVDGEGRYLPGYIEFKTLETAEKALATLQNRPLPADAPPCNIVLSPFPPTQPPTSLPPPSALPRLVKQLPSGITDAELYDLFRPFGPLANVRSEAGFGPDIGVVEFWSEDDARRAEETMHCAEVGDQTIAIQVYQRRAPGTHTDFSANAPPFVPASLMYQQQQQQQQPTPPQNHAPPPLLQYSPQNGSPSFPRSPPSANGYFVHGPGQQVQYAPPFGPGSGSHSGLIDPCKLFIKNLDHNIDSSELFTTFRRFGQIVSARVMRTETGQSRGFGFVSYQTPDQASSALNALNGTTLGTKPIIVRLHEPKQLRQEKLTTRYSNGGRNPASLVYQQQQQQQQQQQPTPPQNVSQPSHYFPPHLFAIPPPLTPQPISNILSLSSPPLNGYAPLPPLHHSPNHSPNLGAQQQSSTAGTLEEASNAYAVGSVAYTDVGAMITWISPTPFKLNGGFGDVFAGTHSKAGKVALKRPRIGPAGYNEDLMRRFQREAATWEKLQHPHILKYLGTFQRDGHLYFVSPFIENGTLVEYIVQHPSVNRIKLVCETADAISYLHAQGVVHGDIKASNLLVGDEGQVLLCDFGLTKTIDMCTTTAMKGVGSLRWQSPELWKGGSKSFKSDVYAFGMTIAEVLTGYAPFPDLQTEGAVFYAILVEDRRPTKIPAVSSTGLSYKRVWTVAEACWSTIPDERISMKEASRLVQEDLQLAVIQEIDAVVL